MTSNDAMFWSLSTLGWFQSFLTWLSLDTDERGSVPSWLAMRYACEAHAEAVRERS